MGLVLCARLAGDRTRGRRRCARSPPPATAPLGAGVYLSLLARGDRRRGARPRDARRRGAVARAAAGRRSLALASGAAAAACAAARSPASRRWTARRRPDRDGAIALVLCSRSSPRPRRCAAGGSSRGAPAADALPWARRLAPVAAAAVAAVAVGLVVGGLAERPSAAELAAGAQAQRLTTVSSNRYEYWRVGLAAFADHPLDAGSAPAASACAGCRSARSPRRVRDVHSLVLEQAAELGLAGPARVRRAARRRRCMAARDGAAPRSRGGRRRRARPRSCGSCTPRSTGTGSCRRSRCPRSCWRARSSCSRAEPSASVERIQPPRARRTPALDRRGSRPRAEHREDAPRATRLSGSRRTTSSIAAGAPSGCAAGAVEQRQVDVRRGVRVEQPRGLQIGLGPRQRGRARARPQRGGARSPAGARRAP